MPAVTRDNIGTLRPTDLLGAMLLFEAKYEAGEDE